MKTTIATEVKEEILNKVKSGEPVAVLVLVSDFTHIQYQGRAVYIEPISKYKLSKS